MTKGNGLHWANFKKAENDWVYLFHHCALLQFLWRLFFLISKNVMAPPMAYGNSQDKDQMGAAAVTHATAAAMLGPLSHCSRPGIEGDWTQTTAAGFLIHHTAAGVPCVNLLKCATGFLQRLQDSQAPVISTLCCNNPSSVLEPVIHTIVIQLVTAFSLRLKNTIRPGIAQHNSAT